MRKRSDTFTNGKMLIVTSLGQEQSNFRSNKISCLGQFQLYLALEV